MMITTVSGRRVFKSIFHSGGSSCLLLLFVTVDRHDANDVDDDGDDGDDDGVDDGDDGDDDDVLPLARCAATAGSGLTASAPRKNDRQAVQPPEAGSAMTAGGGFTFFEGQGGCMCQTLRGAASWT